MNPREFTIRAFFEEIHGFDYVVQRNWDNLPVDYAFDGHDDLDLFATDEDKRAIEVVLGRYPEVRCDVRSPQDDYYPEDVSSMLLMGRMEKDGFWIPAPLPAFFALYYHNLIHKQGNPYGKKLDDSFKAMFPPVRCKDAGVGFHGSD